MQLGKAHLSKPVALLALLTMALALTVAIQSRAEASTTVYGPWVRVPTSPSNAHYTYCRAIAYLTTDSLGYVDGQGGSQCQATVFLHSVYGQLQPLSGPKSHRACSYKTRCTTPFVSVINRSGSQRYCLFAEAYWNGSEFQYGKATACAYY
jgi:hypothetical protein